MKERRGIIPLLLLSFVVSAAVLWPLPLSPDPYDHSDTLFNTWLTAWNHHAMTAFSNPLNTPQFAGFPDGRGRSDLLLAQWLFSLPLRAFTGNPIRIHNLLMWISLSLTGLAAGFLARDRGASGWGAAFASTAFVSLPYFQSHLWHLQLSSVGLTLAGIMFALRTVEGRGGGKLLALLIPLQGLASLYHWYFLNLALLVILVRTLFTADRAKIGGLLLYTALGNAIMLPFLLPQLDNAARWDVDTIASTDVSAYASPWHTSFLTGWLRTPHAHPEAALWPGLSVLAGAGWAVYRRNAGGSMVLLILGVFFAAYSLGPTITLWGREIAPGPFRLIAALPGGTAVRLPARAGCLALLPLIVAAARQLGRKPFPAIAAMVVTLAEAAHPPIPTIRLDIPAHHEWIAGQHPQRVLYIPVSEELGWPEKETQRLYWSTLHFTPSVNGYSTSFPEGYARAAAILNTWPSEDAVTLAVRLGVDLVIIEGGVPDDADETWFDGKTWAGAVWLAR